MQLEEQEALLGMWMDFLEGRQPSAALMREFYFEVISRSRYYRYGMAPEVFDLLVNGPFETRDNAGWTAGRRAGPAGSGAASPGSRTRRLIPASPSGKLLPRTQEFLGSW